MSHGDERTMIDTSAKLWWETPQHLLKETIEGSLFPQRGILALSDPGDRTQPLIRRCQQLPQVRSSCLVLMATLHRGLSRSYSIRDILFEGLCVLKPKRPPYGRSLAAMGTSSRSPLLKTSQR